MNRSLVMLAIMLAGMVLGFGIGGLVFPIVSPRPKIVSQLTGEPGGVGTYRLSVPRHVETLRPIIIPPTGTEAPPPYWSQPETEMSP